MTIQQYETLTPEQQHLAFLRNCLGLVIEEKK